MDTPKIVPMLSYLGAGSNEDIFLNYLTCGDGLQLLSCGLDNTRSESFDAQRYVIPLNETTCQCKDAFKIKCIAICESLSSKVEIVSKSGTGRWTVPCPSGKRALGCHIKPGSGYRAELWRQFYPIQG